MAQDNKSNFKKLNPDQRKEIVKNLTESLDLLNLQAEIAEARARIKKGNLEELIYAIKISEMENPPKPPKDGSKN